MINKVYEYFKAHPMSTHRQCAIDLGVADMEMFVLVREMKRDGYLREIILPLGNEFDPQCSNFYMVK